jgi:transcriptional regulator with XRE-family HTH domain
LEDERSTFSRYIVRSNLRQTPQPQPALGKAIRQLREKQGVSQERLAPEAGISPNTLSLIERGEANPTWGTVRGIADALGVSMGELAKLADKIAASEK